MAIFWELFSPRKFIGETHFRGLPGRELTAAAAFAASDLVIRIACPYRSPAMPQVRRPRQSVLACRPSRRACSEMDALVLMVKLNCAGLSGRPVIRPRPFSGSQVSYSRQRAITEARRDVPTTQKAAAKSHGKIPSFADGLVGIEFG